MHLSLAWALRQTWMEAAVIGITSLTELDDLLSCWDSSGLCTEFDFDGWAWFNSQDLDPRSWT